MFDFATGRGASAASATLQKAAGHQDESTAAGWYHRAASLGAGRATRQAGDPALERDLNSTHSMFTSQHSKLKGG